MLIVMLYNFLSVFIIFLIVIIRFSNCGRGLCSIFINVSNGSNKERYIKFLQFRQKQKKE